MSNLLSFQFKLMTPEKLLIETDLKQLSLPGSEGEITVLPHHLPLTCLIRAGVIALVRGDDALDILSTSGGVLNISSEAVVLLADSAEHAAQLDEAVILAAKAKAQALKQSKELDLALITALIEKELARDRALKRWKKLKNIETIN